MTMSGLWSRAMNNPQPSNKHTSSFDAAEFKWFTFEVRFEEL